MPLSAHAITAIDERDRARIIELHTKYKVGTRAIANRYGVKLRVIQELLRAARRPDDAPRP